MKKIVLLLCVLSVIFVPGLFAQGQKAVEKTETMELSFWTGGTVFGPESADQNLAKYYQERISQFEQENNVRIVYYGPSGSREQIRAELLGRVQANNIPDIFSVPGVFVPVIAPLDITLPFEGEYSFAEDRGDFLEGSLLSHTYNNQQVSWPFYITSRWLFYRKDVFKKLGLNPPASWEELRTVGKQLAAQGYGGLIMPGQTGNFLYLNLAQQIRSFGVDYADQNGKPLLGENPTLDAIVQVYQFYHDLMHVDNVIPRSILTMSSDTDLIPSIINGEASMWFFGDSPVTSLEISPGWVREHVGVVVAPSPEGQSTVMEVGGWGFMMKKQQDKARQDMAYKFIQWMTTTEALAEWITLRGTNLPARLSSVDLIDYSKSLLEQKDMTRLSLAINEFGKPLPVYPYSAIMDNEISRGMADVFLKTVTPLAAANRVAAEVNRAWERSK